MWWIFRKRLDSDKKSRTTKTTNEMKESIKLTVRVAAEHPDAETFKCLGNKIVLELDDYDYAYEFTMTMLNLRGDNKFEHGDLMFFNKGILIEIDR